MVQYPDSISITFKPESVQDPTTGIYSTPTGSTTVHTFDCRAEVNGKGGKIMGRDGSMMDYAFDCFMPLTSTVIPDESEFTLTAFQNAIITGKVKRSKNGQLNSRLWL